MVLPSFQLDAESSIFWEYELKIKFKCSDFGIVWVSNMVSTREKFDEFEISVLILIRSSTMQGGDALPFLCFHAYLVSKLWGKAPFPRLFPLTTALIFSFLSKIVQKKPAFVMFSRFRFSSTTNFSLALCFFSGRNLFHPPRKKYFLSNLQSCSVVFTKIISIIQRKNPLPG